MHSISQHRDEVPPQILLRLNKFSNGWDIALKLLEQQVKRLKEGGSSESSLNLVDDRDVLTALWYVRQKVSKLAS